MTLPPTPLDTASTLPAFDAALPPGAVEQLLAFATGIGVGVEATALGDDDNPITDFIGEIEAVFGGEAAAAVTDIFDQLIATVGPDLLADVEPLVLPPDFDLSNDRADWATVELPDAAYIVDLGTPENVGNGELARIILRALDRDGDDDDAEQILLEIFTGRSGANLDFETEPGIDGVELIDISREDYTLAFETAGGVDVLTLEGPGVEALLDRLDTPLLLADGIDGVSLVEVGAEHVGLGDPSCHPLGKRVGNELGSKHDVKALLHAGESGDDGVSLLATGPAWMAIAVHTESTRETDTLVLFGDIVEAELACAATPDGAFAKNIAEPFPPDSADFMY
jgi:hypothetical protein